MKKSDLTTEELMELLFKERDINRFLNAMERDFVEASFSELINEECGRIGKKIDRVIADGNIEKSYGYKLFSGSRNPSRDTVIQLAFGMGASVELTQKMLRYAQKSELSPRVKRDATIIYCLHNSISLIDAQIVLHDLDLLVIGGEKKSG